MGFGAEGRIPSRSIRAFAADHGLNDPDDFAWFLAVIREMDAEYLGMRQPVAKPQSGMRAEVSVHDAAGIRGLLRRLAKRPTPTSEA